MPPHIDLVIVFKASAISLSKQQTREDALKAEKQYSKLLATLTKAGLLVVGRRGEKDGELLILLTSPPKILASLVHRERHRDFLYGLPTSSVPSATTSLDAGPLTPAERLRHIHCYITSLPHDGGLGIAPKSAEWDLVDSILPLHNCDFNQTWLKVWTTKQFASVKVEKIRDQFGDSVALYFSFISTYTVALLFPSVVGCIFWYLAKPYSPIYSTLLVLWSVTFVEYWRIRERILALRWGTRGSLKVEKHRAHYEPGFPWWKREMRVLSSIPVILFFAAVLASLLTGIFMIEAFVSMLYTGPAHMILQTLSPTILFMALVPHVLKSYHSSAKSYTAWENHAHQSTYEASLAVKTFFLSAIVAYLGLGLSAFVYVPFGGDLTGWVQQKLSNGTGVLVQDIPVTSAMMGEEEKEILGAWNLTDVERARERLNPGRLQEQMLTFMVSNQVVNLVGEVLVPFLIRKFKAYRNARKEKADAVDEKKKKVAFEDEVKPGGSESEKESKDDREFLEKIRSEVAMPPPDLFTEYNEMITQFGYVALWSTIWPLAGVMAMINNVVELRSDAFKITHLNRRAIPLRTDTIGPWMETMTFITWFGAVTNSALVYLYDGSSHDGTTTTLNIQSMMPGIEPSSSFEFAIKRELLLKAALIALGASHGFIIVRGVIKHILEMMFWRGSPELREAESTIREVKVKYLESVEGAKVSAVAVAGEDAPIEEADKAFWAYDEGLDEIRRAAKDA